jgi:DNA polymerase III alpha subunit
LVEQAAHLNMPALALTDHDAVYGAARFVQAARQAGIHPILGAELTFEGGAHLTLLVEDATGWFNLCWLISRARHNAPKGEAALPHADLPGHTAGRALCLAADGVVSQRRCWRMTRKLPTKWPYTTAICSGQDRFWIELQHLSVLPRKLLDNCGPVGQT